VSFDVAAGETYYVVAGDYYDYFSTEYYAYGDYVLTTRFSSDPDAGGTLDTAAAVTLSASGDTTTVQGHISPNGDLDVYRFVATVTGTLSIRQEATAGSDLDSVLTVYDASGIIIAFNDDANFSTFDSAVTVDVVAGQTYYAEAAGYYDSFFNEYSTGDYTLSFMPIGDDFGDTTADCVRAGSVLGTGNRGGNIERTGDVDVFSFVAPSSGTVLLSQTANGSFLDSTLTSSMTRAMWSARTTTMVFSLDSRLVINVTAGRLITSRPPLRPSPPSSIRKVPLAPTRWDLLHSAARAGNRRDSKCQCVNLHHGRGGRLSVHGHHDRRPGIRLDAGLDSSLDTFLSITDGQTGRTLARNDDSNGTLNSRLVIKRHRGPQL